MTPGAVRPPSPASEASRARRGLVVVFFTFGVFNGTWVSRIPFVAQHLRLDTAHLSLALITMPVGQFVAAQLVAPLVRRFSSAAVVRGAIPFAAVCLVLPGLASGLPDLALALALFGLSMGTLDIAMNSQGVAVERLLGRPVMSGLHGFFSVGAFAGAGLGALATSVGVDPVRHFVAIGILLSLGGVLVARSLLGAAVDRTNPAGDHLDSRSAPTSAPRLLRQPFLLTLGAVAFCALFAEGAVDNWSGIYLHESLGSSLAVAPYGAAASGAGMAVGRFGGDRLVSRWGPRRVLDVCAALATVGMTLSLVASGPAMAVVGYGLFGLGSSTLVPIVFTLAGNLEGVTPAWAISRVTSIGFGGLFGAPPVIGLLAGATSLRLALGVAALLTALVLPLSVLARRLRAADPPPETSLDAVSSGGYGL